MQSRFFNKKNLIRWGALLVLSIVLAWAICRCDNGTGYYIHRLDFEKK